MTTCRNPFISKDIVAGCGNCLACREMRQKVWKHRIMLESLCHKHNSFVSLSYSDDCLPTLPLTDIARGTLIKSHPQLWLKRLRKAHPTPFRFFLVGEYGSKYWRPHYHAALFGFIGCQSASGVTRMRYDRLPLPLECCASCRTLQKSWPYGVVHQGTLTDASAKYIAGYAVKRLTSADDVRLRGRAPEFARFSLKPGIGVPAMHDMASTMMEFGLDEWMPDVPYVARHGSGYLPLGRTLRMKLRTLIGRDKNSPLMMRENIREELRQMRQIAYDYQTPFSKFITAVDDGKFALLEAKQQVFGKKG